MNNIDPWSPDYVPPQISWFRRHRAVIAALAGAVIASVATAAPLLWLIFQQQDELKEIRRQEHVSQQRATAALAQLHQTIERFLYRVNEDPALKHSSALNDLRKKTLLAAIPFYEWYVAQEPNSPDPQLAYAHALGRLGRVYVALGEHDDADAVFATEHEIVTKLLGAQPGQEEYHSMLGDVCQHLALAKIAVGRSQQALPFLEQAILHQSAALHVNSRSPRYRGLLANHQEALGAYLCEHGKATEGEELLGQALTTRTRLIDEYTAVPEHLQALASIQNNLANHYRRTGRRAEAETKYREALGHWEQLAASYATVADFRVELNGTRINLAALLRESSATEASLALLTQAVVGLEPIVGQDSRLFKARQFLRDAHRNRAELAMQLDKPADAVSDWERAIALDDGGESGRLRQGLLAALIRAGDFPKALAEVDGWSRDRSITPDQLVAGARLCAAAMPSAKQPPLRDRCAAQAMALIREAVRRGFNNLEAFRTGDDFKDLQDREGFQTLLKELESKSQSQ